VTPIRPEDLNLSALPRSPLGHLKADAVGDLLQRAAWDYREALAQNQRLARTVEELTKRVEELTAQIASLEVAAARHKDPDELARTLLASAQRAAREERESARREAELVLKKAARRAKRVEEDARRHEEDRVTELVSERTSLEVAAAREHFDRELRAARSAHAKKYESARAEAEAELADARKEMARLENEAARLGFLVEETKRRVVEVAQGTLDELERLSAATTGGAEAGLLGDLRPALDFEQGRSRDKQASD
jgi:cell division initiation protein